MKIIATNKKANFDYQISLNLDAGIVLTGPEVKSLRNNSSSIKESYIENNYGELWLCDRIRNTCLTVDGTRPV